MFLPLVRAGGNMYPWVDYTYNPLAGKCPHDCSYCYMKRPPVCWSAKYKGPLRIHEKEMNVNLHGLKVVRRLNLPFIPDNTPLVFVCSGNDLGVASLEIKRRIFQKCQEEPANYYLFQSKNPTRFVETLKDFPPLSIFGTTLETNREDLLKKISKAPSPFLRVCGLLMLSLNGHHTMVSVEPKMKCDPEVMIRWIAMIAPDFVSVGADSGNNGLPEPSVKEVKILIDGLKKHNLVLEKENLGRLLCAS